VNSPIDDPMRAIYKDEFEEYCDQNQKCE